MRAFALVSCALTLAACSSNAIDGEEPVDQREDDYTSASGRLLDVEFDGEVLTADTAKAAIDRQMLYTIGHFNEHTSVSRLDKVTLTNIKSTPAGDLTRVTYHAKLPVSWGKKGALPKTYELVLPKQLDFDGEEKFFNDYSETCVDWNAHDNSTGIFWYYYRPGDASCKPKAADVLRVTASVALSPENSKNKYPEYDRIWEDGSLKAVVIFGKVEDGTKTEADRGIWSYNHFLSTMRKQLPNVKTMPVSLPDRPGIEVPEATIDSTLPNGTKVSITAFLVDNVREGGAKFEARYNALSTDADVIVYNGHAGLGENVRKLATMGTFKKAKYQMFYMNGCDTFAYVDGSLAESRGRLNKDDPSGTKYMEILTNSMPPNWDSLPNNTISLLRDLQKVDAPLTYKKLLGNFDQSGIVVVTGEEDNVFKP